MERWRRAWRYDMATYFPTPALLALREGLVADDLRLVQGKTVLPMRSEGVDSDEECRGGCAIAYAFMLGCQLRTVGEVYAAFEALYESANLRERVCQSFTNWFDRAPREEMRRELLAEVERSLEMRRELAIGPAGILADWLAAAERVHAGSGPKAKGKKRKGTVRKRELVSC